jgi:hypothetical protein
MDSVYGNMLIAYSDFVKENSHFLYGGRRLAAFMGAGRRGGSARLAIARKAKAGEAEQHHRPGRGLGDGETPATRSESTQTPE